MQFTKKYIRQWLDKLRIKNSPFFDADWYQKTYPEIGCADPPLHYLERGAGEGKNPSTIFDTNWYLRTYPDVAAARMNPLLHYLKFGFSEGRFPRPSPAERQLELQTALTQEYYLELAKAESRLAATESGQAQSTDPDPQPETPAADAKP